MNRAELALRTALAKADNAEQATGGTISSGIGAKLANVVGNTIFSAEFDINIAVEYQQNNIVMSDLNQLPQNLKTDLAFPFMGQADYKGGYKTFRDNLPINGWEIAQIGIVGIGYDDRLVQMTGTRFGDMVIYLTDGQANPQYEAFVRVRCLQTSYGKLLNSNNSDLFTINKIRYNLAVADVAQYQQQLKLFRVSLFGSESNDEISPSSFLKPDQFQSGVVDIPIEKQFTKEDQMCSYIKFGVTNISWNIFVQSTKKISN